MRDLPSSGLGESKDEKISKNKGLFRNHRSCNIPKKFSK
jgi:hypothetical protein